MVALLAVFYSHTKQILGTGYFIMGHRRDIQIQKTNTSTELSCQCFLWNVQPAGTMLLHMIMMIYGKLWSLLCHYLLDEVYMKAVLNGPTFNGQWSNVTVEGMDYVVFVLLNPASKAVAALCKYKPEATPPGIA
ncbi:hypothetical protein T4D_184 [Trichinella pseudospiralis]|uniref:Uncharacterized protein n=1 Tax=Trichinella pseudospiralis TaxID=6337 RepID=A0A0V1F5I7_TRIPS|nr:hypothetical protein T4D_184 [Trichinella pseudospiralis]